jgi:hypothetical protein
MPVPTTVMGSKENAFKRLAIAGPTTICYGIPRRTRGWGYDKWCG